MIIVSCLVSVPSQALVSLLLQSSRPSTSGQPRFSAFTGFGLSAMTPAYFDGLAHGDGFSAFTGFGLSAIFFRDLGDPGVRVD